MYNNGNANPTNLKIIFLMAEHGSTEFEEFLDVLGDKVDMKDWPHYRGDLSNKGMALKAQQVF